MSKSIIFLFYLCIICTAVTFGQSGINYGDNKDAGGFKNINGIRMYYESYGTGKPLIILHGSGGSIRSHATRIEYFKQFFHVIAIDSRAHGKSSDDLTKTLTYTQMANDVKTLMDSLHIDSAYIWGQSDGGILGLLIAVNYPQKVARLATYGANLFPGKKAIVDDIEQLVVDSLKVTTNMHTKRLFSLLEYQPNITQADLHKIKCPVLVMCGDRDAIRLEHSTSIFYGIENANLFVMPGATHFGASQKPELFNMVLLDFFNKPFSKLTTYEAMTGKRG